MNPRTTTQNLASFDDRLTMRHVRVYGHPVHRVWDAVTTTEQLDVWLLPAAQIERRQGGRCSFSWGSPVAESIVGTVAIFDPPRVVRYQFESGGFLQFTLEEVDGGTRLTFLQNFAPGDGIEPREVPGGDQPAGADTPWRPGFVAGFHEMLDDLDTYLDGGPDRERVHAGIDAVYSGSSISAARDEDHDPRHHDALTETYRAHIRRACPRP